MNCPHPSNIRHVHIASQVFPDDHTVIRDERCLCCDVLLSVTYTDGVEVSATVSGETPETVDVLPPVQPVPEQEIVPVVEPVEVPVEPVVEPVVAEVPAEPAHTEEVSQ